MSENMDPEWLILAKELQSIGQAGLTYSKDAYDIERFHQILSVAARLMEVGTGEQVEKISQLFKQEVGYMTPKIDVRGAVFEEGKILMVREVMDGGKWTLPGGWADVNLTGAENAKKEVEEETGIVVAVSKLVAVYDRTRQGHTPHPNTMYKMFFICTPIGGEFKTSIETGESRYFSENEIPEENQLSLSRILPSQIKRLFEHYRNPALPTDFD